MNVNAKPKMKLDNRIMETNNNRGFCWKLMGEEVAAHNGKDNDVDDKKVIIDWWVWWTYKSPSKRALSITRNTH